MTLKEAFARPEKEDMGSFEEKVYLFEDILKLLMVRWYLLIIFYGIFVELKFP